MSSGVHVIGGGAVTPVGLNGPQTCAGIRARAVRIEEVFRTAPFGKPQAVARVPAHWILRRTPVGWLVNLAARAVAEISARHGLDARRTALVAIPPEPFRQAGFDDPAAFASFGWAIAARTRLPFRDIRDVAQGGAASTIAGLRQAAALLASDGIDHVIVGGADSYVIDEEYVRLDAAGRLRTEGTAQGLTPGEGAAFVLLARERPGDTAMSLEILGTGDALEPQSATSSEYSQGRALVAALRAAASAAGLAEAAIDWVVSNGNGERYASWEALLARARYYRTRRERLIVHYPALSVGEIGAASGPLALLMSAHGFARGYRPGSVAMIELASEGEGRAACVVRAARRRDGS